MDFYHYLPIVYNSANTEDVVDLVELDFPDRDHGVAFEEYGGVVGAEPGQLEVEREREKGVRKRRKMMRCPCAEAEQSVAMVMAHY